MSSALLALAAAIVLAIATGVTKRLVSDYRPEQLIGPLLVLNAAIVAPFLPLGSWEWGGTIAWLHLASAVCLAVGSGCVFLLFVHGSAPAVAIGSAMTPIGALSASAVLLVHSVRWTQVAGAVVVAASVVIGIGGAFGAVTRGRAVGAIVLYAAVGGLLTVLTKLLAERGVGLPDIYVTRTLVAGIVWTALVPPRDLPLAAVPKLTGRSALQTGYFVLLIAAVQRGTPTVVQTIAAATPLILLGGTAVVRRERPSVRLLAAAVAVVAGIGLAVS